MARKLRSPSLLVAIIVILAVAVAAVAYAAGPGAKSGPDTFKANNDGTVTDTTTGLVWQQMPQVSVSQAQAQSYCASLTLARKGGWRLPTMYELVRLVDYSHYYPAESPLLQWPAAAGDDKVMWSSTPDVEPLSTNMGWTIKFSIGVVAPTLNYATDWVRCVRG